MNRPRLRLLTLVLAAAAPFSIAVGTARAAAANDPQTPSKRIAERVALQGKGEPALAAFREGLTDPRPQVRAAAVQLLAKEAGRSAVPA